MPPTGIIAFSSCFQATRSVWESPGSSVVFLDTQQKAWLRKSLFFFVAFLRDHTHAQQCAHVCKRTQAPLSHGRWEGRGPSRGGRGVAARKRWGAALFAYAKQRFGVSLAMPRWGRGGGRAEGGWQAASSRLRRRSPAHLRARGIRSAPAQRLRSTPVYLPAVFLREAATSQARLCLALLHTSGLYLRPTIYNECLRNSRGRTIIPSLASLVGQALAASRVSPLLRPCRPAEWARRGPPAVGRGSPGAAGSGPGCAPAGGSAGEEVSSLDFVSANPFPRLNRPPKYLSSGLNGGGDPSWSGLKVRPFPLDPCLLKGFPIALRVHKTLIQKCVYGRLRPLRYTRWRPVALERSYLRGGLRFACRWGTGVCGSRTAAVSPAGNGGKVWHAGPGRARTESGLEAFPKQKGC